MDNILPKSTIEFATECGKQRIDVNHLYLICNHALGAFVLKTRTWSKCLLVPSPMALFAYLAAYMLEFLSVRVYCRDFTVSLKRLM